jgi:hypothetical protein
MEDGPAGGSPDFPGWLKINLVDIESLFSEFIPILAEGQWMV